MPSPPTSNPEIPVTLSEALVAHSKLRGFLKTHGWRHKITKDFKTYWRDPRTGRWMKEDNAVKRQFVREYDYWHTRTSIQWSNNDHP